MTKQDIRIECMSELLESIGVVVTPEQIETHIAVKIAVIESEAGWGSKIDDYMVCLSVKDAEEFSVEFNSKNDKQTTPDWYMATEGKPEVIDLNDTQYTYLKENDRVWLSTLNKL